MCSQTSPGLSQVVKSQQPGAAGLPAETYLHADLEVSTGAQFLTIVPSPRGKRDMSSLQGCCTLCSILLLLGGNLGVVVEIRQDLVNGTVGQSVLLPVSYTLSNASGFPLVIFWTFHNSSDRLTSCTVQNCSLGAGGVPSDCFANCFTHATYHGRAELFPQNGSLLLRDLQLRDSGVYNVTFISSHQTWDITLTVHEQCRTPENPGPVTRVPCYIFGGCYCFILLLLQLCWCRAKSQEASNTGSRSVPGSESGQSRLQHGAALQPQ